VKVVGWVCERLSNDHRENVCLYRGSESRSTNRRMLIAGGENETITPMVQRLLPTSFNGAVRNIFFVVVDFNVDLFHTGCLLQTRKPQR
jgi:hypothetical protein